MDASVTNSSSQATPGVIQLPGYSFTEKLYEGSRTAVYRGIREQDGYPVVVKLLKNPLPSFKDLVQFSNQYSIIKGLDLPNVVTSLALVAYGNGSALVMEDFGGCSLQQFLSQYVASSEQNVSIKQNRTAQTKLKRTKLGDSLPNLILFFQIALQVAEALEGLSKQRIIHKDIKPDNIVIHPDSRQVKLIDFSIASTLPRETQTIQTPKVLEGTLAYLSPEQTGRMNRGIDYRSDFYSFGVTCYELLTGKLPFEAKTPIEVIHGHLARQPAPISEGCPAAKSLPAQTLSMVSAIVLKLMAKNAEDRYQSAFGLQYDLEQCLHQLKDCGYIEQFELGSQDLCDRFILPEKLYGRQPQIEQLLNAFERTSQGSTEMMLVTGFSGVGKTAVVNEIHKPITRQQGYFVKGKYDQLQLNVPFSAFIQAFRQLLKLLLTENDLKQQQWRKKILAAVGDNGQLLIEVIPELTKLIGPQPAVPALPGNAAENRFNRLMQQFVQVFSSPQHPLVIFLDDLQWADAASLHLMQLLMQDNGHLLLIGAYRNNEVAAGHALLLMLEEISASQQNTIELTPLSPEDLDHFVADTLRSDIQFSHPLSELIYQKTAGNPFFSAQCLLTLQAESKIAFSAANRRWEYNVDEIAATIGTDNVVEFMGLQLQKLPDAAQNAVKIAACIGAQFDLATLAIAAECSPKAIAQDLWQALQEGLIIPTNNSYKAFSVSAHSISPSPQQQTDSTAAANPTYRFMHDRVQQAAYALIDPQQQIKTHYTIGQRLLHSSSAQQIEQQLFDIVNHLNKGCALLTTEQARKELLELNLKAGLKAQSTVAYAAALNYLGIGISLLKENSWTTQYELSLTLYNKAAAVALLLGDLVTMQQYIDTVLQQGRTLLDKACVYESQLQAAIDQEHFLQSIEVARGLLSQLGVEIPTATSDAQTAEKQAANEHTADEKIAAINQKRLRATADKLAQHLKKAEEQHSIEQHLIGALTNLPAMTDLASLVVVRILSKAIAAAYVAQPELVPSLVCAGIDRCIDFGNSPLSALLYSWYGVILCSYTGDIDRGYQMGELALLRLQQHPSKEVNTRVTTIVHHLINPWKAHLKQSLSPLQKNYQHGLENGDSEYASLSACLYSLHAYLSGYSLSNLATKIGRYRDGIRQHQQESAYQYISLYQQITFNLLGQNALPTQIEGEAYSEAKTLPLQLAVNDIIGLAIFYSNKGILQTLFGEYAQALATFTKARQYIAGISGSPLLAALTFYESVACLNASDNKQFSRVVLNQRQLEQWAKYAPMNHAHRWHLIEAERARCSYDRAAAIDHYDQAIALAQSGGFVQEVAIAQELASQFYLQWGKVRIAKSYLTEAYYSYSRWGAKAKVTHLEACFPKLLNSILQRPQSTHNSQFSGIDFHGTNTCSTNGTGISEVIDLATLLHTSQALSSEIELENLLTTLLDAAIKNAGADKCILLMPVALSKTEAKPETKDETKEDVTEKEQNLCHSTGGSWVIEAFSDLSSPPVLLQSLPLDEGESLSLSLIEQVKQTCQPAVIFNAAVHPKLVNDPYVQRYHPKSVLCIPIVNQGKLVSILYLENNLTIGAFSDRRVEVLELICTQAAISLENARLYRQTQQALQELQNSHMQLVQSEKMSALGNMVSGIAHEINNPVNFLQGNLKPALNYVEDIMSILEMVQENEAREDILEEMEEINLAFVQEDLPNLLQSMSFGISRIRDISTSLRTFSRADKEYKTPFDIHDGLDSTLLILKHRLRSGGSQPSIEVVKQYGNLPEIDCFAGQLNQVFMNLMANAIDAMEEADAGRELADISANPSRITITTSLADQETAKIIIADSGPGMSESIQSRIFDHLFTTKPVGKGTGLGLSISYSIVVEKHGGMLSVNSKVGEGTAFTITLPL